jgi:hypothetical protein
MTDEDYLIAKELCDGSEWHKHLYFRCKMMKYIWEKERQIFWEAYEQARVK